MVLASIARTTPRMVSLRVCMVSLQNSWCRFGILTYINIALLIICQTLIAAAGKGLVDGDVLGIAACCCWTGGGAAFIGAA